MTSIPSAAAVISQPTPAATPTAVATITPWLPVDFDVTGRSYVTVNGLTISGGQEGLIAGHDGSASGSHRCFTHNTVEYAGNFGIAVWGGEYDVIFGNIVHDNAKFSPAINVQNSGSAWWSGSGISLLVPISADHAAAWHNWISHNISYNNDSPGSSDGDGIIYDSADEVPYLEPVLIEENLCYGNGGEGIREYDSHNVMVRNNTVWKDVQDTTAPQELENLPGPGSVSGYSNVWINNIAVATRQVDNSALAIKIGADYSNVPAVENNLTFCYNSSGVGLPGTACTSGSFASDGNVLGSDPLLTSPSTDFHLQGSSPALGAGTSAYGVPATDMDGNALSSPPPIGAYSCEGGSCPTATATATVTPTATSTAATPTPTATSTGPTATATPTATSTAATPTSSPTPQPVVVPLDLF